MTDNNEMMKVLETIADRLVDMHLSNGRQFDELNRKLEALLAVEAGDQLPLFAVAAAAPASVVPNEDEAMPVVKETLLASCPTCGTTAYTDGEVELFFGYRTPAGKPTIVQSWCRECRALEQATSPRKKQRLPDDVRDLGMQARDLHKQADAKAEERAKVLAGSKGRETKDSVVLLVDEQDLRTEAVRLLSEYDQKRGILRKAKKAAK
jgi:hypothetical protein